MTPVSNEDEAASPAHAYPASVEVIDASGKSRLTFVPGLTKRELFAAMAMQGLIARGISYSLQDAHIAVRYADAVLTALDVSVTP